MKIQTYQDQIAENLERVQEQIVRAAQSAGRSPQAVKLVVVTKGHPFPAVEAAVQAGARRLGENYVDEGVEKIAGCLAADGLEWHMIGHVQSRKARPVAEHFDWLHSLDSLKLAQRINQFAGERGRRMPVLLECNVSGEQSKFGFSAWDTASWPELAAEFRRVVALPNLELRGLMTMAPFYDEPELARPTFQALRRLQEYLVGSLDMPGCNELSMGMSGDFEAAIQEGATLVRIGTAIMGPRLPRGEGTPG